MASLLPSTAQRSLETAVSARSTSTAVQVSPGHSAATAEIDHPADLEDDDARALGADRGAQAPRSVSSERGDADDPPVDATCGGHGPHALIGESAALHAVRTVLHKFAPVELPVLVTGETGTG